MGELDKSLTPGVVDNSAKRIFTQGGCGALAIALHDITGWPIVAITDHHNVEDGRAGLGSALHWAVRHPSGLLLDINGYQIGRKLVRGYDDKADDGKAAIGITSREHAEEWWQEAGEKVSLPLAMSIAHALLDSLNEDGQ